MTLLEYERFSFGFEKCVINYFSISILSLTHLFYGLSVVFTIRIGIHPIRITDYRYKLICLHGSTYWLGDSFPPTVQLEKISSLTRLTELKLEAIGRAWLHDFSYWLPGFLLDGQGRRGFKISKDFWTNSLSMDLTLVGYFDEFMSWLVDYAL